ncbi:ubiquinol--cytochrome-c reductase subunit 2 KNAG_0F04030 [Huiozyma naganishii CBS 8797]|uniref:Cytochrome b-c1 complex subunit 2, mitochondrial n=1 Tax=Huiozyma naganishii (strain ATCC MYA-139 / BCRC 22969 / CBS 8797 / KCTC 17520 / NBRC 10181 / NCYC 3082 / Yp74L-3) TaxID=1071383 RepID=J7S0N0_HUIN7|nr:hypothetical protein KNAG_0F04030 [Kazachstania naganishii CBS 8797]CCK71067.1 hypothetical protein KNAG_0F04030 [Kazachstania naganishii CBS 8797]
MLRNLVRGNAVRRFTVAARESVGTVSSLEVKVHAGARYAALDGVSHLLSRFNFQNTGAKSALRLVRESELLGGQLSSHVDREFITLRAVFLQEQLPYYVEALGNVLYKTSFKPHELVESVLPAAQYDVLVASQNPLTRAENLLYNVTYRKGLGNPVLYDGVETVTLEHIKQFANKVYTRENIAIEGRNVVQADLQKFLNDSLISSLPAGKSLKESTEPATFTGETRLRSTGPSVAAIAVPLSKDNLAVYEILSNHLNATGAYKHVFSKVDSYNNAYGLFQLFIKDADAETVATKIKKIVSDLKKGVDISTSVELTKLKLTSEEIPLLSTLNLDAVKNVKLEKFNYVAVGDVSKLPYLDEL